jgi:hypothetical protein
MNLEHEIRVRAYSLWEQEGRTEGRALDYWSRAEREVAAMQDALKAAVATTQAAAASKPAEAKASGAKKPAAKKAKA